jgi:amino acid transporter
MAGTLLWFSDALACGAIAASLADVCASLAPPAVRAPARAAVIIGVVGGIALVNLGGVARGARLVNAATMLKLVPLAVFIAAGAGAMHSVNFLQSAAPTTGGLGRALILALFAFTGMETSLSASGEVAQPSRTIPRALAMAMLIVTLLYVAVQIIAQGILGASLEHSTVPLADAMARISPALSALMLAGAALSMFGWIGGNMLGTPRMLFAFARDGYLPSVLGRVHPRSRIPHVAILCYAALAIGLALSGTFAELAVLATLGSAAVYIAGCAAAWRLARRGVARAGVPLNYRWLRAAMLIGIASMLFLIALASRAEIIGLIAVLAGSAAIFFVSRRSSRGGR